MVKKKIILSDEQEALINAVCSKDIKYKYISVSAYAGAAKSSSIIMAFTDKKAWFKSGYMLSFNRKIAVENQHALLKAGNTSIKCSTIHSFALQYLKMIGKSFKISNINSSYISSLFPKYRRYSKKLAYLVDQYCKTDIIGVEEFLLKNSEKVDIYLEPLRDIISSVFKGKNNPSHSLYLKWAMIEMESNPPVMDIIAIDECQDLNRVSFRIFELIDAKKKIGVGDSKQSIQGYLDVVNGLLLMMEKFDAVEMKLTKSFRCSTRIANIVNDICLKFKLDMKMVGHDSKEEVTDVAIITRTNAEVVTIARHLMNEDKPFKLGRDASSIVGDSIYLLSGAYDELMFIKKNKKHSNKYVKDRESTLNMALEIISQESIDLGISKKDYRSRIYKMCLKIANKNSAIHKNSLMNEIQTASMIVASSGLVSNMMELIVKQKEWKDSGRLEKSNLTLLTCHTSKGLTFSHIYLTDRMSESVLNEVKENHKSSIKKDDEAMLFYVALTRARFKIFNVSEDIYDKFELDESSYKMDRFIEQYYRKV